MGVQGDRLFAALAERGSQQPWAAFAEHMSWDAAYAVQLKEVIDTVRTQRDEQALNRIVDLFDAKAAGLDKARQLLEDVLLDYDESGMWAVLDERAARLDIDDVSQRWARNLVHHPHPVGVLSMRFNWQ